MSWHSQDYLLQVVMTQLCHLLTSDSKDRMYGRYDDKRTGRARGGGGSEGEGGGDSIVQDKGPNISISYISYDHLSYDPLLHKAEEERWS